MRMRRPSERARRFLLLAIDTNVDALLEVQQFALLFYVLYWHIIL